MMNNPLKLIPVGSVYKSILPDHEIPNPVPKKMKAWVTYKGTNTVLEEVPVPKMLPDDVLIEPLWISICASDVNKFVDLLGKLKKTIFGHEFAGRVVATGENVNEGLIGKMVVVEEHYPCLHCHECLKGMFDKCRNEGFLGWYKSGNLKDWVRNGAFAEYVSIHYSCAKPTQGIEKLDFFPSLAEPFGNAVKMGRIVKEKCDGIPETLAIWGGCGAQALYMVPYFTILGVKNFVLIYRGKSSMLYMKECIKDLKARFYFIKHNEDKELERLKNELTQGKGFITIELTGNEIIQNNVLKYASREGKIFYYGLPGGGKNVFIPGTDIDIYSFITGKAGIDELNIGGITGIRVMGRDNESWDKTIEVLKAEEKLRNALMKPFVIAGTTRDIGDLVDYLINNGVRYEEEPYGIRPAKFAVVNDKIMS